MKGFLLDTHCISELVCPAPNRGVVNWMEEADEDRLFLSVLTIGEIRKGLSTLANGKRKTALESWLSVYLPERFAGRILPIDLETADIWGALAAGAKRLGKTLPVIDGLLAATALQNKLSVVSRNVRDFEITEVAVVNPWR